MVEKRVDDDWKRKAREEKETLAREEDERRQAEDAPPPPATFATLVATLATPLAFALGEIEDPTTKEKRVDLRQARMIIDLLAVLQEKTRGNLEAEEERFLQNTLTEFRFLFVQASQQQASQKRP
jgi:hypothetical protein